MNIILNTMKTIKLYDENAYIKEFEAEVLSCEKSGKYYVVTLDKTAFFPEGGGQQADKGTLSGVKVKDVKENDGEIVHLCESAISGTVKGEIDWESRFDRMQNHSGEHIFSGLVHKYTGADNVSFSLTDSECTLAFNTALSDEILSKIEKEANETVFEGRKINCFYPSEEELKTLDYRSKLDLTENVRLVKIEGVDLCACCAPHCKSTAEIGLIKIISKENYKAGGTKLFIACGMRALEHHNMLLSQARDISHLLCAKIEKTASAVERLKEEKEKCEYELVGLKRKNIEKAVENISPSEENIIVTCEFKGDDLRLFADKLKTKVGGIVLVLEGDDNGGYRYVLTSSNTDISPLVSPANTALNGKGGGRDNMARGNYSAKFADIKSYFENL